MTRQQDDVTPGVAIEQGGLPLDETARRAAIAERTGYGSAWLVQLPNKRDALTTLTWLASQTEKMTLGTAIVPMYSRPPVTMAQTALTLDELSGGRVALGLGVGNPMVAEWTLGTRQGSPLRAAREYLTIVGSLVRDGEVSVTGRWHSGNGVYAAPRRPELPIYLGTFGPRMIQLAGELADGLILWVCPPEYVADVVMPNLRIGWARRERPLGDFPVIFSIGVSVTDAEHERAQFARGIAAYARVPAYRRLFEASGFGGEIAKGTPGDEMVSRLTAFGSEEHVAERVAAYRAAGITRFIIGPQTGPEFDEDRFVHNLRVAQAAVAEAV